MSHAVFILVVVILRNVPESGGLTAPPALFLLWARGRCPALSKHRESVTHAPATVTLLSAVSRSRPTWCSELSHQGGPFRQEGSGAAEPRFSGRPDGKARPHVGGEGAASTG